MKRNKLVEVRVTESRKSEWKKYANELDEVTGLSDLVRLSVEQKANGAIDREAIEGVDTNIDFDETELTEQIHEVAQTEDQILDHLTDLKNHIDSSDGIEELVDEIVDLLIRVPDEKTFREIELTGTEHHDSAVSVVGTAHGFAEYLSEDLGRVRRALARAHQEYPGVCYTVSKYDQRQYFKIDRNLSEFNMPDEVDTEGFQTATQTQQNNA